MTRPTDWTSVGWSTDPTPGDPVIVRDGGHSFQNMAATIGRALTTMRGLGAGLSSGAQSVDAVMEGRDEITAQLETAKNRYQAAGDALVDYAYTLDLVQATTLQALTAANTAQEEVDESTRMATQYGDLADQATAPEQADDQSRYTRMKESRERDASNARSRVHTQTEIVNQAHTDHDRAANTAADRIEEITLNDGLNDSWWDNVGAKAVALITDIAEWISTIAGILALIVCWIPIIGPLLAGALLIIAAVTAIMAALGNIALAATGERSWGEAALSIVGAVLACVGLKAAALAGKAAFNAIMKTGVKMSGGGGVNAAGLLGKTLIKSLMRPGAITRIARGNLLRNIKGRIGEEIMNLTTSNGVGKLSFKLFTGRMGKPDGMINVFGRKIFAECKNLGWNTQTPGVLGATTQMRGYIDLAAREGDGTLRVITNSMTDPRPLLNAIKRRDIPKGEVIITHFEDVLGTKLNAWMQATMRTGFKLPLLSTNGV